MSAMWHHMQFNRYVTVSEGLGHYQLAVAVLVISGTEDENGWGVGIYRQFRGKAPACTLVQVSGIDQRRKIRPPLH